VLLPGGEHFGPLEQPELLIEHIRRFCGSTVAPAAPASRPMLGFGALVRPIGASDLPVEAKP
jgi:hypothetical protein